MEFRIFNNYYKLDNEVDFFFKKLIAFSTINNFIIYYNKTNGTT